MGPSSYSGDMSAPIRIGTCSWADDALAKHWYPPGTPPKERLPYYAERYSTVEVDSTFTGCRVMSPNALMCMTKPSGVRSAQRWTISSAGRR